jgi:hypothetical protein
MPIHYDRSTGDLHIELLFKSEERAEEFMAQLMTWGSDISSLLRGRINPADIEISTVPHNPAEQLQRVNVALYEHTADDDSPTHITHTTVDLEVTSDIEHQMVERKLTHGRVHRCHIVERNKLGRDDPRRQWDRNNLIYMYPTLHQLFDGTGSSHNNMLPSVVFYPECYPSAVPPAPQGLQPIVDETGHALKELRVVMEFCSERELEELRPLLRPHHEDVRSVAGIACQDRRRLKFVFLVQDPQAYADNLVERAYDTFRLWQEMDEPKYPVETMLIWAQVKEGMDVDQVDVNW